MEIVPKYKSEGMGRVPSNVPLLDTRNVTSAWSQISRDISRGSSKIFGIIQHEQELARREQAQIDTNWKQTAMNGFLAEYNETYAKELSRQGNDANVIPENLDKFSQSIINRYAKGSTSEEAKIDFVNQAQHYHSMKMLPANEYVIDERFRTAKINNENDTVRNLTEISADPDSLDYNIDNKQNFIVEQIEGGFITENAGIKLFQEYTGKAYLSAIDSYRKSDNYGMAMQLTEEAKQRKISGINFAEQEQLNKKAEDAFNIKSISNNIIGQYSEDEYPDNISNAQKSLKKLNLDPHIEREVFNRIFETFTDKNNVLEAEEKYALENVDDLFYDAMNKKEMGGMRKIIETHPRLQGLKYADDKAKYSKILEEFKKEKAENAFKITDPVYFENKYKKAKSGNLDPIDIHPEANKVNRADANFLRTIAKEARDPKRNPMVKRLWDLADNDIDAELKKGTIMTGFTGTNEANNGKRDLIKMLMDKSDEEKIKMLDKDSPDYVVTTVINNNKKTPAQGLNEILNRQKELEENMREFKESQKKGKPAEKRIIGKGWATYSNGQRKRIIKYDDGSTEIVD